MSGEFDHVDHGRTGFWMFLMFLDDLNPYIFQILQEW
jgi:hypothetical protein